VTDDHFHIANPGRATVLIVAVVDQQTQRSPKFDKVRAVSDLIRMHPPIHHVITNHRRTYPYASRNEYDTDTLWYTITAAGRVDLVYSEIGSMHATRKKSMLRVSTV
jgi:hypothetical protein